MSESRPVYIPCASGNQLMTDCLVRTHDSLVEILGHPTMHFAPANVRALILALEAALREIWEEK